MGPATTLAGRAASGIGPSTGTSTGATASWAPAVTPSPSRNQRGPGTRAATRGERTSTPAEAATDSRNPSEWTSNGSTMSSRHTAMHRWRTPPLGRPVVRANNATPATNAARSTEGSNRVTRAKAVTTPTATTNRGQRRNRCSNGPTTTSTNATF